MSENYCTQNGGDCITCSLSNYGRDCHNQPISTAAAVVVDLPNFCHNCGARWASFAAGDMIGIVKRFNAGGVVVCLRCGTRVKKG